MTEGRVALRAALLSCLALAGGLAGAPAGIPSGQSPDIGVPATHAATGLTGGASGGRKAAFVAGFPPYQPEHVVSGEMRIVAEKATEKLMKLWMQSFKRWHPNLELIVAMTSPLAAVPTVTSGANEIGFPAREAWPYESEVFRQARGYELFVLRVGLGSHKATGYTPALGVYVNERNPIERLTLAQLDAIYSSERRRRHPADIDTWGQLGLGGEWANRPIKPYGHRLPNGIRYFFHEVVNLGAGFKRSVVEMDMRRGRLGPDDLMARATAEEPGAIGYGCFGNLVPGMKTIAIAETDRDPYLRGTFEEVANFRYPLARSIYMTVDRPPGKSLSPKLKEFLSFVLSHEGQQAIVDEGNFLPLPAHLASPERERLK